MSEVKVSLGLQSPWMIYYHQVEALFSGDPDVKVSFDNDNVELTLYVNGESKADAISKLLGQEKVLGNVTVKIKVVPANLGDDPADLIRRAFEGNANVEGIYVPDNPYAMQNIYVVFAKEVVQYKSDNIASYAGVTSTLYEQIAREVIGDQVAAAYCTSIEDVE